MSSIARSLAGAGAAYASVRADELCAGSDKEQNWETGETTWHFADGSTLRVCGTDVVVEDE